MGRIVTAAKITHVPSMFISEQEGPHHGCRAPAIAGLKEIAERARAGGADTFVVLDTHWLVNSGYHINANSSHEGCYTSNEFPHFIKEIDFKYSGATDLGHAIAATATAAGVVTRAHDDVPSLGLEYGTLVPMKYMNNADAGPPLDVLPIASWMHDATFEESRVVGEAIRTAVEASDRNVCLLASGSMSHRIWSNDQVADGMFEISRPFNALVDQMMIDLLSSGRIADFLSALPDYAEHCSGEGGMHDTAMLLAALGWDRYQGHAEVVTEWFASSGTGQCNLTFPVSAHTESHEGVQA
ncbi:MAG: 3,4-dihydroxyphenylacetate 2,3-dioxygenase [Acidimicrobiales bacterium]